ncbi:PepSY domain-containing protein [Phenylobacterium sp.]|uniref:PepSY domain-containing protein n=1 Tax=Phenylobacterium sp. TaxID=1871053 RepID=UPI002CB3C1EF|nr:PepSY domain-containing protein [Phenylobacterium sp.]HLZ74924.1 PepSY domain-containing protein [Phenylobacterium sp.]
MAKSKTARTGARSARPRPAQAVIRDLHVYVSVFVAPSLLFFALTGALQTFRIPDQPSAPMVIQKLARLHKDDVFAVKPARPKRPQAAHAGGDHDKAQAERPPEARPAEKPSTEVMKWFFAAVSVGVATTTLFGLWMALAYSRRKLIVWALLIAGAAAPVLILMS